MSDIGARVRGEQDGKIYLRKKCGENLRSLMQAELV